MRINSRKKGKRGERKAKEVLQKWTKMEFAGVPQSGGLRWAKADHISGDIICTDPLHRFNFSVEVKNYREINFEHLLMDNQNAAILEFWDQCKRDAKRGKKLPLLMMRYDGIRPGDHFFTVISTSDFKLLKPKLNLSKPYLYCKHHGFVIMHPTCLFKTSYKDINKIAKLLVKRAYGSN